MKMTTKLTSLAVLLMTATGVAQAQQAPAPSFDKIGVSYLEYDLEGEGLTGAGANFSTSMANTDWFFAADFIYADDDYDFGGAAVNATASNLYANFGYKFYQVGSMVGYASAGLTYANIDVEAGSLGSYDEDDTGWNAQLGMRARLNRDFEVDANVRHVDIYDDSDQEWSLSGRYYITDAFSLGAGYTFVDSDNGYVAFSGNWHF